MHCPNGHGARTRGKRFWLCKECDECIELTEAAAVEEPPKGATALPELEGLPSLLAIPLHEYEREFHPVMRLHRLCDAVEIITRFCTIVALAELHALPGAAGLPEDLLQALQPRIEQPTIGRWLEMLEVLLKHLLRHDSLVMPELSAFARDRRIPDFGALRREVSA